MKRILCALLCLCLLLGFAGCGKEQSVLINGALPKSELVKYEDNDNFHYTIYKDYVELSYYTGTEDTITIPTAWNGQKVVAIGRQCFANTAVKNVVIPDSVEIIEVGAFYQADMLESVTIGKNVVSIENTAFYGCTALTAIHLPKSVQHLGRSVFMKGNTLITVDKECGVIDALQEYGYNYTIQ